ncbi:hypothetical protein [Aurantibacter sp.]|uniref:hypothetical protein n=1 Tax=Aurantibacter sp. TaxID=2807103 RepID=UPI0032652E32
MSMILVQRFLMAFYIITQVNCQEMGKLNVIADMPSSLKESSGMATYNQKAVWVVEDSGNHDKIYKVDLSGDIKEELEVKNGKNHDWEDLTTDTNGNLYIGDFGNNTNKRKNLVIYKLPNPEKENGDKITAEKIEFNYPNQNKFPPKKSKLYFDAEAFFHWNGFLYVITKNRSRPYDGKTMLYRLPDKKGEYEATFIAEWTTCLEQDSCSITSADISSDGKTIALLSNGLIWLITDFNFENILEGNIQQIDLAVRSQLESICFLDDTTLLLSDERSNHEGGNLYQYTIQ